MHPILFRIPLPTKTVPLLWALLIAAGVLLAYAAYQHFVAKRRDSAIVSAVLGVGAAGASLYFKGETWNMAPIPIYSYGVMLGLSLVVGWYLTLGLAEREGLPKETMANCYVFTAVAAVVGSRVLYILTNLDEFDSIGSMFAMRRGGLVAYGGFLGGFLGSLYYLRRHKLRLLPWADVAVPSLASGLMITRIGCYLFGCDFGKPLSEGAPGWLKKIGSFPHWPDGTLEHGSGSPAWVEHVKTRGLSQTADYSLPVHPTQIYESLVGLFLLGVLLYSRRFQKFRGQIFLLFTFSYGVLRFLLEIIRDDPERGSLTLKVGQTQAMPAVSEHILIPICMILFAIGWVVGFSRMVTNANVRKATQVLAFVPAVVLYFLLKPSEFGASNEIYLSTSQFVGLATAVGAGIAFKFFDDAAKAHPETAMSLGLPSPEASDTAKVDADEDEDLDEDDDAAIAKRRRAKKAAAAKKAAEAAKAADVTTSDDAASDDAGSEDAKPSDDAKASDDDAKASDDDAKASDDAAKAPLKKKKKKKKKAPGPAEPPEAPAAKES